MRTLFALLIFVSFFAFTDDHKSMYQPMYAEYSYCSQIVEDDDEAQEMLKQAQAELASMKVATAPTPTETPEQQSALNPSQQP